MKITDLMKLSMNYDLKIHNAKDLYDENHEYQCHYYDIEINSNNQFKIYFSCELSIDLEKINYGPCLSLEMNRKNIDFQDLLIDTTFMKLWNELVPLFDTNEIFDKK